jgi:hypothetical protein
MKKIGIGLVIVLAVCILLAALAPFLIDLNKYKDTILTQLKPYVPRDVDFQSIELTILTGLGAELRGLRISDNPNFSHGDFLRLESLQVRVQILPLITGQIKVKKVLLKKPLIRLARNAKGVFSFDDLLASRKDGSKKAPLPSEEKNNPEEGPVKGPGLLAALLVNDLEIQSGKIIYQDEMQFAAMGPMVIDRLDLDVQDLSLNKPISFKIAADVMEAQGQNFQLSGRVGPVGEKLQAENIPFDARLSLEKFPISRLKDGLPKGLPVQVLSGDLSMNLEANGSLAEKILSKSDIELKDLVFEERKQEGSAERSGTIHFTLTHEMSVDYPKRQISLQSGVVSINGNRLLMKGTVDNFLKGPQWDVEGWTEGLQPAALVELFPMFTNKFPKDIHIEGPAAIHLQSSGSPKKFHMETNVDMNAMKIQYKDLFQKPVGTPLSFVCKGNKNAEHITFEELQVILHQLIMTAPGEIMITGKTPQFNFQVQTRPVPLKGWDALVPLLSPYHLEGSLVLQSSFRGTPQEASFSTGLTSDHIGFDIPQLKEKKILADKGPGVMDAIHMEIQGKKEADQVYGSGKLAIKGGEILSISFQRLLSDLQVSPDQLKISDLELGALKGSIQAKGAYGPKKKDWSFETAVKDIAVGEAVDNLTEYKDIFSGTLSGTFQAEGSASKDRKDAMHAQSSFRLSKGELKNFNLTGSVLEALFGLKGVGQFLDGQQGEVSKHDTTQFESLEGKIEITGKTLRFESLQLYNIHTARASDSLAILEGKLAMDTKLLDLKGKLILSQRHSLELAQKASILEALFDKEKRIVLPITIKGTLKKPIPFLDQEYVLGALAKHYGRKAVDQGLEKLQKKLGLPKETEKVIEKPVKDLLKGLFGK